MHKFLYLIITICLFAQCRTTRPIVDQQGQPVEVDIHDYIVSHPTLREHFTGFVLYDPSSDETLVDVNGDLSFTPASNTKLPTYLAARMILGDSIPSFAYAEMGDTIVLQGTGAPFHFGQFDDDHVICLWLGEHRERAIYYDDSHNHTQHLGSGWTWDDYLYDYQKEVSTMPLYDNAVHVSISDSMGVEVYPPFFIKDISVDTSISWAYDRSTEGNEILINPSHPRWSYRDGHIPMHTSPELTTALISDACDVDISVWDGDTVRSYTTVYQGDVDSLYRFFLKTSDNYIAEQIHQMISYELYGELDLDWALDSIEQLIFGDRVVRWVDGSGLSRYNLFSPQAMISVLERLDDTHSDTSDLAFYFPYGDEMGTIDSLLISPGGAPHVSPYIYAKTGTLSNNHNLSGWIITRSGRRLLFSMMNNHYHRPKKDIIGAMHDVLSEVYHRY